VAVAERWTEKTGFFRRRVSEKGCGREIVSQKRKEMEKEEARYLSLRSTPASVLGSRPTSHLRRFS